MPNTWVTTEKKTSFGPSNSQTSIAHNAKKDNRDTWPHLLLMCEHPYMKGLRIARHNNAVHLINQTLQANKHTRYYTLTNAGNFNNIDQQQIVP